MTGTNPEARHEHVIALEHKLRGALTDTQRREVEAELERLYDEGDC